MAGYIFFDDNGNPSFSADNGMGFTEGPVDGGYIAAIPNGVSAEQIIDNGYWSYNEGAINFRSPRPDIDYTWDKTLEEWTVDIEAVKLRKSNEVTYLRNSKIIDGIVFDGHTYNTDIISLSNISERLTMTRAGIPFPEDFIWRSKENINVPFTEEGFFEFAEAVINYKNAVYMHAFSLKDQISTIESVEELIGFDINVGWPSNGG